MSDDVHALHARLTRHLSRTYPMVSPDDIKQELWAAYYASEHALDGAESASAEAGAESGDDEYTLRLAALKREMRNAAERMCRREKAAIAGYEPRDEVFYSSAALRQLLEAWFSAGVQESPPKTVETSVSRTAGDAAEGGNWLVSLVDVGVALKALGQRQREILYYAYSPDYAGRTDEEIAIELHSSGWKGLTEDTFKSKVRWALVKLQKELGGRNPWQKATPRH